MSSQKSDDALQAKLQSRLQGTDLDTEIAHLMPNMSRAERQQLTALLDSSDTHNHELIQQFLSSLQSYNEFNQADSKIKTLLPEGTTEESLAKEVAKIEQGQSILKSEQQEAAMLFDSVFDSMAELEPCNDIEAIRMFANAATLKEAFELVDDFDFSTIVDTMPQGTAELVHAAIACQLAGMTKPANLLFKLFSKRLFIDANEEYQNLQTDITKHKGAIETAKYHSKKGENSRHAKNRERKEFAIGLYKEKPYKNPKQAAERLFSTINNYSNSMNHPFTSEYQGLQTVYRWFLAAQKTIR